MQQHVRDYTELCLKDAYGIYTVQQDQIDMNINDLIEHVIKPVLLAAGYSEQTVEGALGEIPSSDESCPYKSCPCKPELEKILDALHANNAEEAIATINDLKGLSAAYYSYKSDLRNVLGARPGESPFSIIRDLKSKADRWDKLVDVLKTHPITEVLIDGDRYTLHSVNHKNHVLGEVIKVLGLPEDAKLNDALGMIARILSQAF